MTVTPENKKWLASMACIGIASAVGVNVFESVVPTDVFKLFMACSGAFLIFIAVIGLIRMGLPSFDEKRRAIPMLAEVSLSAARAIMVMSGVILIPLGWWCIRSYFE